MVAITAISNPANDSGKSVGPHIFFRPVPEWVDAMVLAANTAEVYTVPDGAKYIVISSDVDFYANKNATAAVPTTEVTNGTAADFNPVGYVVKGGESLSFLATAVAVICISVYSKEN